MYKIRLLLFITWVVALLTGCSFRLPSKVEPTITVEPTVTPEPNLLPTPHLTATALSKQAPLLATLSAQSDFTWNVRIVQNENVMVARDGVFQLQRKPFTLLIEVSKPVGVYLNALDTDDNFVSIQAGLTTDDQCILVHPFCSLIGMYTVTQPNELIINKENPNFDIQGFVVNPRLGEIGSQFTITSSSIIFERYISQITLYTDYVKTDTGSKRVFTEVPIEEFTSDKLYLVFLAKHRNTDIINEDELQKFIIAFQ